MLARVLVAMLCLTGVARAAPNDAEGCQDPPLFTRLAGYFISRCEVADFDELKLRDAKGKEVTVEGRVTRTFYSLDEGATLKSQLQIIRNYENAFRSLGGALLHRNDDGEASLRAVKGGGEVWAYLNANNPQFFSLSVVEKSAMNQEVQADAAAFAEGLAATGHAAVYGIYFDTNKSEVKPESAGALGEVAKLLSKQPALKLLVVGHTDSVGALEANLKLSSARAEAVVKALTTTHGVAPARLKPQGAGPIAPVASNRTEEGRAKNRRVELVEQ